MLEIFATRRFKKNREDAKAKREAEAGAGKSDKVTDDGSADAAAAAAAAPVLSPADEAFLKSLIDDSEGPPPALPPRLRTPQLSIGSDTDSLPRSRSQTPTPKPAQTTLADPPPAEDDRQKKRSSRLAFLFRREKPLEPGASTALVVPPSVSPEEAVSEERDLSRVLDRLSLSADSKYRVFSVSNESAELVRRFNQVLRDLVEGVPTAYGDLTRLLDDRDGVLDRAFDKLPKSLRKMVVQLPDKISDALGPEVLAAAAEAGGLGAAMGATAADGKDGKPAANVKGKKAVKMGITSLLTPANLQKIITKPGTLATMLRSIVNALRARWPAFISTNIIWSISVFILLFVLWYCHKRGREVRHEREARANALDENGQPRIIEEITVEEVSSSSSSSDDNSSTSRQRRRRKHRASSLERLEAPPSPKKLEAPPSPLKLEAPPSSSPSPKPSPKPSSEGGDSGGGRRRRAARSRDRSE